MADHQMLLSDLCRPKCLDDLNLPEKDMSFLKAMLANPLSLKNLLFWGRPGIGKTSAALILTKGMEMSVETLDARSLHGGTSMRTFVESYFSSVSLDGNYKTLIINEADTLKARDQNYLLDAVERFSKSGRFIMTANTLGKLIDPLRSRLTPVCFDVPVRDRGEVIERMVARYQAVLDNYGLSLPVETISQIVHIYFPDLRATANMLERESMYVEGRTSDVSTQSEPSGRMRHIG